MPNTRGERGAVLPLTLIIMMVLVGLVTALLAMGVSEPLIAANLVAGTQAFHLAEAGIERAFGKIATDNNGFNDDLTTGTLFNAVALGAGAYTVTAANNSDGGGATSDLDDTIILRSTGTGPNGATRTLEAIVTTRYDFRDAIVTNDDLELTGNGCVQGTLGGVHSNGDLTVSGSVVVDQHATATDKFTLSGNATVKGLHDGDQPKHDIPDLKPGDFAKYATIVLKSDGKATDGNGNSISVPKDWKHSGGKWTCCSGDDGTNGIYYIEGDVHVSSSPNEPENPWRATLITTGSLDISGNPSIAPATDPSTGKPFDIQFLAGTDISMGGSPNECTNCLAGLIYAREQFNMNGNVPIRGAVMALDSGDTSKLVKAGRNKFSGSACVILNGDLRVRGAMGPLRIISWRMLNS